jgi:TolB-like protein
MKTFLSVIIIISISAIAIAQETVISISDFAVESDSPAYKYLGKGISILFSGELRKTGKVKLVERDELKRIISEQELSLTDLADSSKQLDIGKLLSANFVVIGEIVDMGDGNILIALRMADVETGEIVWLDQSKGSLATYDYLGAYFAQSLLGKLGIRAGQETLAKIKKREEKKPEAILKASEGIDAYDRNDPAEAMKMLEEARSIDPKNEVATEYLAKLIVNTTKFEIQSEPFYTYQNPAYLGIMKTDRLIISLSSNSWIDLLSQIIGNGAATQSFSDSREIREADLRLNAGYFFPVIGSNWGFGFDAFFSGFKNEVSEISGYTNASSTRFFTGIILSTGTKLSERLSFGAGASVFKMSNHAIMSPQIPSNGAIDAIALSGNAGFLFSPVENISLDSRIGASTATVDSIDPEALTIASTDYLPLFNENTMTWSSGNRRCFVTFKQSNDIAWDRAYYFGRIVPAAEYFPVEWFSFRAALEGDYLVLDSSNRFGFGVMGGITLRNIKRGLDFDLNASYRKKPSRSVERIVIDDIVVSLDFTWNKVFASKKK